MDPDSIGYRYTPAEDHLEAAAPRCRPIGSPRRLVVDITPDAQELRLGRAWRDWLAAAYARHDDGGGHYGLRLERRW